jgi:hypothetical protein
MPAQPSQPILLNLTFTLEVTVGSRHVSLLIRHRRQLRID